MAASDNTGLGLILLPITIPVGAAIGAGVGAARTPSDEEWVLIEQENIANERRSQRLIAALSSDGARSDLARGVEVELLQEAGAIGACLTAPRWPNRCGDSPDAYMRITFEHLVDRKGEFDAYKGSTAPWYEVKVTVALTFDGGTEPGCALYDRRYKVAMLIPDQNTSQSNIRAQVISKHLHHLVQQVIQDVFSAHEERSQTADLRRFPRISISKCQVTPSV